MGATVDMHQIYDAHIHQKGGAAARQLSSFLSLKKHAPDLNRLLRHPRHTRNAAAQEWSAGLYWPGT